MDGDRGYHAWRKVFILDGIATILIGFMSYFALLDFPEEARWLTEEERRFVIAKSGIDEHPDELVTEHAYPCLSRLRDQSEKAGVCNHFCSAIF